MRWMRAPGECAYPLKRSLRRQEGCTEMASPHQIECPCCGEMHAVEVPSCFARVRSAHLNDRGLFFNYVGLFRRMYEEIERRCPNTRQLYHIVCERTPQ